MKLPILIFVPLIFLAHATFNQTPLAQGKSPKEIAGQYQRMMTEGVLLILILRTTKQGLVAHTVFYANEIRKLPEFRTDLTLVKEQELKAPEALIAGYFGSFAPETFQDIYQARLQELIQQGLRKAPQGLTGAAPVSDPIVPDLFEQLRQSLDEIERSRTKKAPRNGAGISRRGASKKKAAG